MNKNNSIHFPALLNSMNVEYVLLGAILDILEK